jgi:trehalose-phosphatase
MLSIPPAWRTACKEQTQFFERLGAAARSVLILDYDGTLAPFHQDKMQAFPYPGIEEQLAQMLALSNVRVVFVTGRPARELKGLIPLARQIEIWGTHGWENIDGDGTYSMYPLTVAQKKVLNKIEDALSRQGYERYLERKLASIAVHWRGAEPEVQQQLEELARSFTRQYASAENFEIMPFEAGLEVRAVGRTKADAVRDILQDEAVDTVGAYLGDDRTDEDAFPVMRRRGISVLVRPEVRQSQADFWMTPPGDLLDFFDRWIHMARSSHEQ